MPFRSAKAQQNSLLFAPNIDFVVVLLVAAVEVLAVSSLLETIMHNCEHCLLLVLDDACFPFVKTKTGDKDAAHISAQIEHNVEEVSMCVGRHKSRVAFAAAAAAFVVVIVAAAAAAAFEVDETAADDSPSSSFAS